MISLSRQIGFAEFTCEASQKIMLVFRTKYISPIVTVQVTTPARFV